MMDARPIINKASAPLRCKRTKGCLSLWMGFRVAELQSDQTVVLAQLQPQYLQGLRCGTATIAARAYTDYLLSAPIEY
jgi:hypothetical protein